MKYDKKTFFWKFCLVIWNDLSFSQDSSLLYHLELVIVYRAVSPKNLIILEDLNSQYKRAYFRGRGAASSRKTENRNSPQLSDVLAIHCFKI